MRFLVPLRVYRFTDLRLVSQPSVLQLTKCASYTITYGRPLTQICCSNRIYCPNKQYTF